MISGNKLVDFAALINKPLCFRMHQNNYLCTHANFIKHFYHFFYSTYMNSKIGFIELEFFKVQKLHYIHFTASRINDNQRRARVVVISNPNYAVLMKSI